MDTFPETGSGNRFLDIAAVLVVMTTGQARQDEAVLTIMPDGHALADAR
jgi:hypothetical protein